LAPHREDLRRSGLSDETIARSGIYSAPAQQVKDLLGYGVGAGMVFPYPSSNGAKAYVRVRLDRPDDQGKRYRSPAKVQNHLYIPPTLDVKRLADVSLPLFFTEGEKKCLKAVQEGLTCVGLAGVWSWRTRFPDKGRGVPLPELEALVLAGRVVYIVFDSDRVTNENVQKAERALAAYLASRGATVSRIPLPSSPDGTKVGLDDYLITHSIETFCAIEPEPISNAAIDSEKPEPANSTATITAEGGMFAWPDGAGLAFSRVAEGTRGIHAEVTVTWHGRVIGDGSLNLLSPRTRDGLAKKLERKAPGAPWEDHLDLACRQMVTRLREGEPVEELQARPRVGDSSLIAPLIVEHETTTLYAAGGAGKSLTALLCAIAARTGCGLPRTPRRPHRARRAGAQLGDRQGVARVAPTRSLPRAQRHAAWRDLPSADDRGPRR
jgi:hypothetical protein